MLLGSPNGVGSAIALWKPTIAPSCGTSLERAQGCEFDGDGNLVGTILTQQPMPVG
jgi:hypothetical protein